MLNRIAAAYLTCKGDLIELLTDIAGGYNATVSIYLAQRSCTQADSDLDTSPLDFRRVATASAAMSCVAIRLRLPAVAARKWVDQRVRRGRG